APQRRTSGVDRARVRHDDSGDRIGIGDDMSQLTLAVQRVDRNEHDAEPCAGEKDVEEGEVVRELHAEPIAAANTARGELGRHLIRTGVNVPEGEGDHRTAGIEILETYPVGACTERGVE